MPDNTFRETLLRIAILLVWLAGHAERAATVSPSLRRTLLYILRQGEFAALGLLFDLVRPGSTPSFDDYWDAVETDAPEDAMLLAARLRLFAFVVGQIAMLPEDVRQIAAARAALILIALAAAPVGRVFRIQQVAYSDTS